MNQEQPAKFAILGLVIAGVIGGAIVNPWKGSESVTAAMSSPPTFNSTAVGAAVGGLGTGILGLTGVLGWIAKLIGFGKTAKDVAGVQKLIDDIIVMIRAGKVDMKQLLADAGGIDYAALLALIRSLVQLANKTAVMGGGGELPQMLQSVAGTTGASDVVVIEF
mgnify:CR=1 FL=1